MDISEDIRASNSTVLQDEFDDLKLIFYVVCVVFAGAIVLLIGAVIGLYVWILKMKKSQNNYKTFSGTMSRTLQPGEELARRYEMSVEYGRRLSGGSTLDRFPFSRQPSMKKPDILKNGNSTINTNRAGPTKHFDKRKEPHAAAENKRFGERSVDELYY